MRKKVLFLIYQLVGGGAEKIMVDIVNRMDQSLYEITVMTIIDCSKDAHILNENIKYEYIFKGKLKEDRLFFRLYYKVRPEYLHQKFIKMNYDIEIAALEGIPAKIISGCTHSDTKKVVYVHADATSIAWPSKRYKDTKQEFESYNKFNYLIFVSNNSQSRFKERFNINKSKMLTIYNPFDINYIKERGSEPVEDYQKSSKYIFCAIGRLEKVKGFDRLIKAFHTVYKNNKNISLLIVGEGKERTNLSNLIEENKLSNCITLLGYKDNPYKYLNLADCYVCSSRSEGLSSTVIEAMILNKAIVATDCGGMDEILEEYSKGYVINNDISGLVDGMEQILNINCQSININELSDLQCLRKFSYSNYFEEMKKIMY